MRDVWRYRGMKFFFTKLSFFLIILISVVTCEKGPAIPEDKFIKVYVDLLILQDTTSTNNISLDSLKAIVFEKNEITADQYDATIQYYNKYPKRWEEFFDKALAYAEKLKKNAEK
jgi:hypothetical protein